MKDLDGAAAVIKALNGVVSAPWLQLSTLILFEL